jgi:hypothetical protein
MGHVSHALLYIYFHAMKTSLLTIIMLFLFFQTGYLQPKHDYTWFFGKEGPGPDSLNFGLSYLLFQADEVDIDRIPYQSGQNIKIYVSNATMSDINGNLIFYTNGCSIYNVNHEVMDNGDSINPGKIHDDYCDILGYPNGKQTCLPLPWPDSIDKYILFHQPSEIVPIPPHGFDISRPMLYYSVIDMEQSNDGLGKVLEKNNVIVEDSLHTGHITSVRHSNGRDWWVLVPVRRSALYHTLLLTHEGVIDTFMQEIGIPFIKNAEGSGTASFSPDGQKYMRYTNRDGAHLFDFDRATGVLSNFFHIPGTPDIGSFTGASFSPNGRFLYLASPHTHLYQFDLHAPDIEGSKTLVGEYDGFKLNNFWTTSFGDMQLGPDCRIYITTTGQNKYLHVINQPDNPGVECEFIQRAIKLPTWHNGTIPPFPNYRLDTLPTYPCDSTIVLIPHDPTGVWERAEEAKGELKVWPNPTQGAINLAYPQDARPPLLLRASDALGREAALTRLLPGQEQISLSGLPAGIYLLTLTDGEGRRVGLARVVVIR